jgi:hypothetical protein
MNPRYHSPLVDDGPVTDVDLAAGGQIQATTTLSAGQRV